jgi:outer membrane usher protein
VARDRPLGRALLFLALLAAARTRAADEFLVDVKDPLVRVHAELDLWVNGAAAGSALVVIERGDPLVAPADLARAGLSVSGGRRVVVEDRELVSLRSLAPGIAFEVDERALALRITAAPELLGRHRLDLRPMQRAGQGELRLDPSAFLNYAVESDLDRQHTLAFEAGGRAGRWLATTGVTRNPDAQWVRQLSAAVRDDVPRLERLTVGDSLQATGTLGGSALLGGVAYGREFSLDPTLQRAPQPSTTAIVTAPSTVEVYVNGSMVRQQPLAPGYWDLSNVPVIGGQNVVRTVVRDVFGRERVLDSRFYLSSGLLSPGLTDFVVAAGFRRERFGLESFDYGAPAALGRYRWAASEWLTPGVRLEASTEVISGGGSATVGTPWGELAWDASASAARGDPGSAGQLAWMWVARDWSAGLRLTAQSDRYANLALDPVFDRPVLDADAVVGATVTSRIGVAVELRAGRFRDLGPFASAGLRGSFNLGGGFSLTASADLGKAAAEVVGLQTFVFLAWAQGRYSADATAERRRDGVTSQAVSTSRGMPRDTGWGYRVHASQSGGASEVDGLVQGQTSFGRADLQATRAGDGTTSWHARAAGALVAIDRRVYPSRATDGSFALVSTSGLPGVGITVENTLVGRTRADGRLLVTDLEPYYAGRIGFLERDVPEEFEPGPTFRLVAPPLRGGAVVAFDLPRISAVTGQLTVRLRGRDERPANGEATAIVDGALRSSPVTEDGRFFLERMPPGKHILQAVWRGGSCRAVVTLPERAPPVFDAGEVRCIADTLDPSGRIPSLRDPGYGAVPVEPETGAGSGAGSGGR